MAATEAAPVPAAPTLAGLRRAAQACRACELYRGATQAVIGEGPRKARVMLVGEQPGDREDIEGHPFVGPAGRLLGDSLEQAGLARGDVFLTNVVKHFRFEQRGKRRIHQRPEAVHVRACRPWLDAELEIVRPEILVCLGAVAAKALLGPKVRVTADRGLPLATPLAPLAFVTVHPSAVLRAPDSEARHAARAAFVSDLRIVAQAAPGAAPGGRRA